MTIDHVGIGPDFVRGIPDQLHPADANLKIEGHDPRQTFAGLAGSADLPLLTQWMLDLELSETDIKKVLGANFLRVFQDSIGNSNVCRGTG